MNVLLVPSLTLDVALLERLARSVDHPIRHKVVINNGHPDALGDWNKRWPEWKILSFGKNLGCAGSWNKAPDIFPNEPSWMISNEDEEFQPGSLEKICKSADSHPDAPIIYVNEHDAYDMFVWTRSGVDEFGTFDENFWPAYFEDYEMCARFLARGGKPFRMTGSLPVKHGKFKPCSKLYHEAISGCGDLNQEYLKLKWGRPDEKPIFTHPFNNPSTPINQWTLDTKGRAKRMEIWNKFWNNNPSLYE